MGPYVDMVVSLALGIGPGICKVPKAAMESGPGLRALGPERWKQPSLLLGQLPSTFLFGRENPLVLAMPPPSLCVRLWPEKPKKLILGINFAILHLKFSQTFYILILSTRTFRWGEISGGDLI